MVERRDHGVKWDTLEVVWWDDDCRIQAHVCTLAVYGAYWDVLERIGACSVVSML